jgi:caffeoyl-CoA O-methyltransferase
MPTYNDAHSQYVTEMFAQQDTALATIYDNIPKRGLPAITIQAEEGKFLQFLVRASGGQKAIEIGTLGGYSGTWLARGLGAGGKLITLEMEPKHAEVAKEHFKLAGVADKVDIRLGDAHKLLPKLKSEGPFDFCFIDAEKTGYDAYLDWALANIRPGGVIAAHNAFRHGDVLDSSKMDEVTKAMRLFNHRWSTEKRLLSTIFPAGDGTLVGVVA